MKYLLLQLIWLIPLSTFAQIPTAPIMTTSFSQNWTKNSDRVTEITVRWQDKSNNETGFDLQWGDTDQYSGGSANVAANITEHKIDGSWPGCGQKFFARVRAKNAAGTSEWSAINVVPKLGEPQEAYYSGVAATAKSASQIELTWKGANGSFTQESEFIIQYSTAVGMTSSSTVTSGQNTESKIIDGLQANTTYYLRIKARNCSGESGWINSTPVNAKTQAAPVTAPNAPSELTLTPLLADNKNNVLLKWKDNSGDETGFEVESSTNGTTFTKATTTAANTTQYEIYLTTSAKNYFRVRAIKDAVQSGYSNVVTYDMGPESPLDLKATVISTSQIDLKWSDRSTDETGYEVERSSNGTNFTKIATLGANLVDYSDKNLSPNTSYWYRVRGIKGTAGSAYTHVVNPKTQAAATSAPTAPQIDASLSQNWTKNSDKVTEITVRWQDKSDNETDFVIQWGDTDQYSGGSQTVGAGVTEYKINGSWPGCGHKVYVRVQAKNNAGLSGWSASILTTAIAIPERPLNVKAEVLSHNQIKVSWEGANESYSRESEFLIRCNTNYQGSGDPTYRADANTDSKVIDVAPNTQFFVSMIAKNCTGNSEWSNLVQAKTPAAPTVSKPKAPTNLVASATGSTQINLTWADNATDEVGFNIERSTDQNNWTTTGDAGVDTKVFSVTGLSPSTKYYFRVFARNSGGNSDYSNVADATTQAIAPAKPEKPTNVTAVATNSSQINLSWIDTSSNEDGFDIERSTDNATWANSVSVAANTTTSSVTGLTASTKYYFRVRSKNGAGTSDWSNVAEATTQTAPVTKPVSPTNLKATASNTTKIDLSWTDASSNEEGFEIERSTDNLTWGNSASVAANTATYSVTGLVASTKYYFRVRAKLGATPSDWSNVAEATTPAAPVVKPATPLNLVATPVSTTQVSLSWMDASSNEEGFEIERSTDNATWGNSASVGANTIAYMVTGLTASTKYYFRVRAKLGATPSDWSNVAEVTTSAPQVLKPVTPGNLRLKAGTVANQITIEWDDKATDETAYEVSRATDTPTTWQVLKSDLPANTKEFTDTPVRSGTKYFYRIRAIRNTEFSEYSNVLETLAPVVSATLEEEVVNWQVYPNPIVETVQIALNSTAIYTIAVLNAMGREVFRTTVRTNATLRVADWPAGIYLLQIKTDNHSKSFKLLKQ